MKTRHIFAIMAVGALAGGLTGCNSEEELTAKPAKEILLIEEGNNIVMASGDETKDIKIKANCAWKMSLIQDANNPWDKLSVQPSAGNGDGTLVILTDQNTAIFDRLDTIVLTTDGGLRQKIAVRQKSNDPTINISQKTMTFNGERTQSQLLSINSNSNWTITTPSGVNWLHIDKLSGQTENINVLADPNTSDVARSTSFVVNYGTSQAEVIVKQLGMNSDNIYLMVNNGEVDMSGTGGRQMLHVESNAEWRAFVPSSAESWLRVEPAQGVGNSEVSIYCEPNDSRERERLSVVVFVAGVMNPKQVDVLVQQRVYSDEQPDDIHPEPQSQIVIHHFELMHADQHFAEMAFSVEGLSNDVKEWGVVYSLSNQQPAYDNSERMNYFDEHQLNEMIEYGSNEIWAFLDNLSPGTYYVRAYVRTTSGVVYSPNVVTVTIQQ